MCQIHGGVAPAAGAGQGPDVSGTFAAARRGAGVVEISPRQPAVMSVSARAALTRHRVHQSRRAIDGHPR
jgi:hypothetical protein